MFGFHSLVKDRARHVPAERRTPFRGSKAKRPEALGLRGFFPCLGTLLLDYADRDDAAFVEDERRQGERKHRESVGRSEHGRDAEDDDDGVAALALEEGGIDEADTRRIVKITGVWKQMPKAKMSVIKSER